MVFNSISPEQLKQWPLNECLGCLATFSVGVSKHVHFLQTAECRRRKHSGLCTFSHIRLCLQSVKTYCSNSTLCVASELNESHRGTCVEDENVEPPCPHHSHSLFNYLIAKCNIWVAYHLSRTISCVVYIRLHYSVLGTLILPR